MKEVKSENLEVKRPWQSYILMSILIFFIISISLFYFDYIFNPIAHLYFHEMIYFFVFNIFLIYLNSVAIKGFLNGLNWQIYFLLLEVIFYCFFKIFLTISPKYFLIIIFLIILYLSISCLKHPFYNQKINKT